MYFYLNSCMLRVHVFLSQFMYAAFPCIIVLSKDNRFKDYGEFAGLRIDGIYCAEGLDV